MVWILNSEYITDGDYIKVEGSYIISSVYNKL